MHQRTAELRDAIRRAETLDDKVALLKDAFAGERCFILTCGPSFGQYSAPHLQETLRNELVLSVKQTYTSLPEVADFHLLNSWNYTEYTYPRYNRPIVILERGPRDPECPGVQPDLVFPVTGADPAISSEQRLNNRLAVVRNFESYTFENQLGRPWGPGIMYELAIYLALHVGVSEMTVLGWDIGKRNTRTMEHFFDKDKPQVLHDKHQRLAGPKSARAGALTRLWGRVATAVGAGKARAEPVNVPNFREDEVDLIADSTRDLYHWLQSRGVGLNIVSNQSLVHECVPRVTL